MLLQYKFMTTDLGSYLAHVLGVPHLQLIRAQITGSRRHATAQQFVTMTYFQIFTALHFAILSCSIVYHAPN